MDILEKNRTSSGCKGLSPFTVVRQHRRITGQVTPCSASLINACEPPQRLLPVPKPRTPRRSKRVLEDGSDPQQQLAVGVCCTCKAALFPQPPPPAFGTAVTDRPRQKPTREQNTQRPAGWAERLLLPPAAPLVHRPAREPRGCRRELQQHRS